MRKPTASPVRACPSSCSAIAAKLTRSATAIIERPRVTVQGPGNALTAFTTIACRSEWTNGGCQKAKTIPIPAPTTRPPRRPPPKPERAGMISGNEAKRSKIGVGLVEEDSLSVAHTPRAYHRHVNMRVCSQASRDNGYQLLVRPVTGNLGTVTNFGGFV